MENVHSLLKQEKGKLTSKDILLFRNYSVLKHILNPISMQILKELSEKEMYTIELAKKLKIHEQKIYYYINHLLKAGLIKNTRTEDRRGGLARYFKATIPAFGVELDFGEVETDSIHGNNLFAKYLRDFNRGGAFNGFIVVGAPDPHGPSKQRARDGHYACQLAMSIGSIFKLPDDFLVKLDVDIMNENRQDSNMILIGGPISNIVTYNVKDRLPIKFGKDMSKQIIGTKSSYSDDSVGIICKIRNPNNKENAIIILAGNSSLGTKSAVLALTKYTDKVLKDYDGGDFYRIIQGFDIDGDGKIDSVEVLE